MNLEKIGKFIKGRRTLKGITQEELSNKLNVSKQAVSKWERGKSFPDVGLLLDLSKELDVSVNDLLLGGDEGIVNGIIYYKNKVKKVFLIILMILFFVLSLFFLTTYKKFQYYKLDNDKVEGFVIKSNIKNIISIKLKEDNVKKIILYYKDSGYDYKLYSVSDNKLYIEDEYYNYSEGSVIFENVDKLYLRVICEEDVNDFKLDFDKVLVNNKLFNFKKGSTINKGKLGIVVRNENDVINDLISKGFKLENGVYVNGNVSFNVLDGSYYYKSNECYSYSKINYKDVVIENDNGKFKYDKSLPKVSDEFDLCYQEVSDIFSDLDYEYMGVYERR